MTPLASVSPMLLLFRPDELKARVPIWKRERYEDGSVWKENEGNRVASLAAATGVGK